MTYVWKLGITADQEVLELFGKALPCKMNLTAGTLFHKPLPLSCLYVLYKAVVHETAWIVIFPMWSGFVLMILEYFFHPKNRQIKEKLRFYIWIIVQSFEFNLYDYDNMLFVRVSFVRVCLSIAWIWGWIGVTLQATLVIKCHTGFNLECKNVFNTD